MEKFAEMRCEVCRIDAPQVTEKELTVFLAHYPEWTPKENNGVKKIKRLFTFKDFSQSLSFTNRVGKIAEAEGHHPAILTEWGKVTVTWWTHKINGLHRNDCIMAAKTEQLYKS